VKISVTGAFDTIAAVSTCLGEAGIGIVRLSGPEAFGIAAKIFVPSGKIQVNEFSSHTVHYGKITDSGKTIDEALLTVMKAPKSYTCEDMAEISCHGGIYVVARVLELCISNGARSAEPGEFTKRAFINGRLDLAQAEAVCDIIKAKTDVSLDCAVRQLSGGLSGFINAAKSKLVDIMATIEVGIDYAEDDIRPEPVAKLAGRLHSVENELKTALDTFSAGKIFREGLRTAIAGRPNVGKSSLLNALIGENRAIVTEVPGTTRDTIEETINVNGIPLVLIDTAGIRRHTQDPVEKIGIDRTRRALDSADLVLFVVDNSVELEPGDFHIAELLASKKTIIVLNKSDLGSTAAAGAAKLKSDAQAVPVSALKATGLDALRDVIFRSFISRQLTVGSVILTNIRHKTLIEKALEHLGKSREAAAAGLSEEFIALDLRAALDSLGDHLGHRVGGQVDLIGETGGVRLKAQGAALCTTQRPVGRMVE